jgi:hypothetical protein
MIATLQIRNRYPGEVIPSELMENLGSMTVDPEWQWLAEYDGKIVGQILGVNAHGILMLIRITATPEAPKYWPVLGLRKVLADARERGCIGYLCFLDDRQPQEVKMMRMIQKQGGILLPVIGVWAAGSTDCGY